MPNTGMKQQLYCTVLKKVTVKCESEIDNRLCLPCRRRTIQHILHFRFPQSWYILEHSGGKNNSIRFDNLIKLPIETSFLTDRIMTQT